MTNESDPISVAGMERTGILIPIITPMSLIACSAENPTAASLIGKSKEMAEFINEAEVRMPVTGKAVASNGLKAFLGFLS